MFTKSGKRLKCRLRSKMKAKVRVFQSLKKTASLYFLRSKIFAQRNARSLRSKRRRNIRRGSNSKHHKKSNILLLNKSLTNFIQRNKDVKKNSQNRLLALREKVNQSDGDVRKCLTKRNSCFDNIRNKYYSNKSLSQRNSTTQRGQREKLNIQVENQIIEEKAELGLNLLKRNINKLLSPRERVIKPSFQIQFSKFIEERKNRLTNMTKESPRNEDNHKYMNYSDIMETMRYLESHRPMIESVKLRRYLNNKTLKKVYSKIIVN